MKTLYLVTSHDPHAATWRQLRVAAYERGSEVRSCQPEWQLGWPLLDQRQRQGRPIESGHPHIMPTARDAHDFWKACAGARCIVGPRPERRFGDAASVRVVQVEGH